VRSSIEPNLFDNSVPFHDTTIPLRFIWSICSVN